MNIPTSPVPPTDGQVYAFVDDVRMMVPVDSAGLVGLGDVTGPPSAADGNLPSFNGTTGKLIKDSGMAIKSSGVTIAELAAGGIAPDSANNGKWLKTDAGSFVWAVPTPADIGAAPAGAAAVGTINFIIDGGGSAITTGIKGDLIVDFACTINSWSLLADVAGAIVVDIWKDSYANFPPVDADSMCSGKEPTIAATNAAATDTTITDWTTDDISAGDVLRFNVDSCATIKRVVLALKVTRV